MASPVDLDVSTSARKPKIRGRYCVAGGPNGVSCKNCQYTEGISLHKFPQVSNTGTEADKEREKTRRLWIKFVERHRRDFRVSATSSLCSAHFEPSCFAYNLEIAKSLGKKRMLLPGAVPTIDTAGLPTPTVPVTDRTRRRVLNEALASAGPSSVQEMVDGSEPEPLQEQPPLAPEPPRKDCDDCEVFKKKIRRLQKTISRLKGAHDKSTDTVDNEIEDSEDTDPPLLEPSPEEEEEEEEEEEIMEADDEDYEVETDYSNEESSAADEEGEEDGEGSRGNRVTVEPGTHCFDEPKFLVFYSMLMSLFSMFCFKCKLEKPSVKVKTKGTMAIVTQDCDSCGKDSYTWRSQPFLFGKYAAGDILISFGILMSGISIAKTILLFKHIGLCMYSVRTYFNHQTSFLFPAILRHWESYRQGLINSLKGRDSTTWSGDGRYDSMGHNAKYGAYTMFSNTLSKLVHFELLQSNQSGSSNAMELHGAKLCFTFLTEAGLKISTFITDRHKGICKWIREEQKDTRHFYDLWHVCKSLVKDLRKASKEKGCEIIGEWQRSIKKHLYWCAQSTSQGFGELIAAKWTSIVWHIADKHDSHPDKSFPRCAHGPLEHDRKWIFSGSVAHDKVSAVLLKKERIADIKKLSSDPQTSCLEGFHSTLNHWHPKMAHFSWLGSYCRHILAVLHFNENLKRKAQKTKDGKTLYSVTYPKFKVGEEVVKEVPSPPTYEYVSDIKNVMLNIPKEQLKATYDKYSERVPAPLCSQFPERRSREEAVKRHEERNQMNTQLYPTEQEQSNMQMQLEAEASTSTVNNVRKTRTCKKCKQPMRGHPRGTCPSTSN